MIKKGLLILAVSALMAAPALGTPSLGWWQEEDPRATHQCWDFTNATVDGGTYYDWKAFPESQDNPTQIGQAFIHGQYDGSGAFTPLVGEDFIEVHLEIGNFPEPLAYKEIWVDVGFNGCLSELDVDGDGIHGPYATVILPGPGPGTGADFGFRIYPNPAKEDIWFTIAAPGDLFTVNGDGCATLDWIHVDTICIPAPGAILLGGIGIGLVGWLRRRRTL